MVSKVAVSFIWRYNDVLYKIAKVPCDALWNRIVIFFKKSHWPWCCWINWARRSCPLGEGQRYVQYHRAYEPLTIQDFRNWLQLVGILCWKGRYSFYFYHCSTFYEKLLSCWEAFLSERAAEIGRKKLYRECASTLYHYNFFSIPFERVHILKKTPKQNPKPKNCAYRTNEISLLWPVMQLPFLLLYIGRKVKIKSIVLNYNCFLNNYKIPFFIIKNFRSSREILSGLIQDQLHLHFLGVIFKSTSVTLGSVVWDTSVHFKIMPKVFSSFF